jgi:hypothetical protein
MAKRDFSAVTTATIKNAGKKAVEVRYFKVNFPEVLEPEDEIVLTVASSEEAAYYKAQENAELGIVVTLA